jgi:hypothetical protein
LYWCRVEGIEARDLIVATIGKTVVAKQDVYSRSNIIEAADETVTFRQHMCRLHRSACQEVAAHYYAPDLVPLCLLDDPTSCLSHPIQIMMSEVNIAEK